MLCPHFWNIKAESIAKRTKSAGRWCVTSWPASKGTSGKHLGEIRPGIFICFLLWWYYLSNKDVFETMGFVLLGVNGMVTVEWWLWDHDCGSCSPRRSSTQDQKIVKVCIIWVTPGMVHLNTLMYLSGRNCPKSLPLVQLISPARACKVRDEMMLCSFCSMICTMWLHWEIMLELGNKCSLAQLSARALCTHCKLHKLFVMTTHFWVC